METLAELLQVATQQYADRDAFLFKPGIRTQRYSYRDVWSISGRVAGFLQERNIAKGDRVIFWAPNIPQWGIAALGCLRAGVVPVPLDVRSTPDLVHQVVAQTQPRLAFLSRGGPEPELLSKVPSVDLLQLDTVVGSAVELPETRIAAGDLAEIMFTSGTTGMPKGVMLTHGNIVSDVLMSKHILPNNMRHRLLSLLPLSHMLEQSGGLFGTLHVGGSVVYPVSRQPSIILKTMAEHGVTTMMVVPQVMQMFLSAILKEVERTGRQESWKNAQNLASRLPFWARRILFRRVLARFGGKLQFFVCGGAYLDPLMGETWEKLAVTVLQGYGTTEASPCVTTNSYRNRRLDSLGQAIPGMDLRLAPDGEIQIKGPNVTQGYWMNPQATAAAFEDGWYKTGDLGYQDENGWLFFKGRKKDLIVLANGQNVFPEDIENVLRQQPGIKDAAVVGIVKDGGAVEVHAALLVEEGTHPADVVRAANSKLASHQQVQGYTVWPLEDLPRTHTLKVKKQEVLNFLLQRTPEAAPAPEAATADTVVVASPLVRLIASLNGFSPTDILPDRTLAGDLSLDSLGRVELLSAIEQELGVYVDDNMIAPETTVAELEQLVQSAPQQGSGLRFTAWPLHLTTQIVRELANQFVIFPLYHLFWRISIRGHERLKGLSSPTLIAPNHNFGAGHFGLDPTAALMALPRSLRVRTCIAGAEDDVFGGRLMSFGARFLANAFPIAREGNVRASLEYVGRLLDRRWSVLIFPEGKLTNRGPIQPFKSGIGLLAVETGLPVIPMKIDVEQESLVQGRWWPPRGSYTVRIGAPLRFQAGTPYVEATAAIEAAVKAL